MHTVDVNWQVRHNSSNTCANGRFPVWWMCACCDCAACFGPEPTEMNILASRRGRLEQLLRCVATLLPRALSGNGGQLWRLQEHFRVGWLWVFRLEPGSTGAEAAERAAALVRLATAAWKGKRGHGTVGCVATRKTHVFGYSGPGGRRKLPCVLFPGEA